MVTTFYPPYHFGGDGIFVYRLSNALARRGHKVDVIHCVDAYEALTSTEPRFEYENHPNVTVHSLKSSAKHLSLLLTHQLGFPVFKGRRLRRLMENPEFDVIHFHNISLIGGPKILEYGNAIKLYTAHEYWLVCPTHVLFKFNREACVKRSCLLCTLSYKRPPQMWRYTSLLSKALKHVNALITPSSFAADIQRRMGLDVPIVPIPYFFGNAKEAPVLKGSLEGREERPLESNPSAPFFLFVGRLEKLKGLQDLIPLFMQNDYGILVVAGSGSYERELKDLSGGHHRIRFLGSVVGDDLKRLYTDALAVVVPSLCYETFGQVILEAFAARTAVIARDIGALSELVKESEGGILYRQPAELQEALARIRTQKEERERLAENGHRAYLRYWTEEQYLSRYFELISEIVEQKPLADRP